jgi:transposase
MKILQTEPHLTDKELKEKMDAQKDIRTFKDWQIIYCVQINYGKKAEEIASMLGITATKVYKKVQTYNKYGVDWLKDKKWGGRREERCHLSIEEEKKLLKQLEEKALNGFILTYKQIKKEVEGKVGKEVSDDYIWDLFKRHNWKKKVPRQSHPKSDQEKQGGYKKNSKKTWQPNR